MDKHSLYIDILIIILTMIATFFIAYDNYGFNITSIIIGLISGLITFFGIHYISD
jgi:hypothetical protein